jgi:DNA-binding response OmpR family regulator
MTADCLPLALIIEDEALLALAMEDLLAAAGFRVVVAGTRVQAEQMLLPNLQVAVVDISLAGEIAGQSLIRFLRQSRPRLPVVVVTGYDHDAPQADLRGLGGPTLRLQKPEHLESLISAVREVISQAQAGTTAVLKERRRRA